MWAGWNNNFVGIYIPIQKNSLWRTSWSGQGLVPHGEVALRCQLGDQFRMQYLEGFRRLRLIPHPGVPLFQELLARVSPIAGRQEFEPHRVTCNVARPVLSAINQR